MPSEPLIALALSLLISLAPFLPAAEKSAPEEEPARVVEEQPALSAEQLAALAQKRQRFGVGVHALGLEVRAGRAGAAGRAVEAAALR